MAINNEKVFPKTGTIIAFLSLVLAVLALLPSAVFSGAIIVSMFAFIGAIMGALSGWKRLATVTIYIVFLTFLINPIFSWLEKYIEFRFVLIFSVLFGLLLIIGLFVNYRNTKKIRRCSRQEA